jgi:polar amino acid transport system substrate-binding protein
MLAGRHMFVEKPMALTIAEGEAMVGAAAEAGVLLTVGFNRRMAPTALALKAALDGVDGPINMLFRVNAGAIPASHWLNDPLEGGGRLLGEGVHFIDFICGMIGADPAAVSAQGSADGQEFSIVMRFADDSLGTVIYTALGDPTFPKERVEAYAGGGVAVLDDFKTVMFHGMRGESVKGGQDKGHRALLDNFGAAIKGEADLAISGEDGLRATRVARAAMASIRRGETISLAGWHEDDSA